MGIWTFHTETGLILSWYFEKRKALEYQESLQKSGNSSQLIALCAALLMEMAIWDRICWFVLFLSIGELLFGILNFISFKHLFIKHKQGVITKERLKVGNVQYSSHLHYMDVYGFNRKTILKTTTTKGMNCLFLLLLLIGDIWACWDSMKLLFCDFEKEEMAD